MTDKFTVHMVLLFYF